MNRSWPTDLTFRREARTLSVSFDDGAGFEIPFELLRVLSPSAEVRGHRAGDEKLVAGKRGVGVTRAEPVGRYAIRIVFDDGHDTGLYSWDYLYELGRDSAALMAKYEGQLAKAGLSR
jgi:DUF971 family protein